MAALQRDEVKRLNLEGQAATRPLLRRELAGRIQEGNELLTLALSGAEPSDALTIVKAV